MPATGIAALVDGVGTHGVLRIARSVASMRVDRWLHEIDHPVLAIGGEHDHVAPLDQLAAFARAVPASETVVLAGVGHMVMLERADALTDEVLAFLQQPRS
jgi:pimeloyl-ACP methyl ester carboxylesterase